MTATIIDLQDTRTETEKTIDVTPIIRDNKKDYISCADTAKIVRKALKEAFAGVKFSVRSKTYSMGASIDVYWLDGPTSEDVEKITSRFASARFDGMTDYKGGAVHSFKGQEVHWGSDYVFAHRKHSPELLADVLDKAFGYYGDLADVVRPIVEVSDFDGSGYMVEANGTDTWLEKRQTWLTTFLNGLASKTTMGEFSGRSELADASVCIRTY